jgi:hypothetical protein
VVHGENQKRVGFAVPKVRFLTSYGVIVSSGQEMKKEDVEVIPVHLVEFLLDRVKP